MEVLKLLIEADAEVGGRDLWGRSLLEVAREGKGPEVAEAVSELLLASEVINDVLFGMMQNQALEEASLNAASTASESSSPPHSTRCLSLSGPIKIPLRGCYSPEDTLERIHSAPTRAFPLRRSRWAAVRREVRKTQGARLSKEPSLGAQNASLFRKGSSSCLPMESQAVVVDIGGCDKEDRGEKGEEGEPRKEEGEAEEARLNLDLDLDPPPQLQRQGSSLVCLGSVFPPLLGASSDSLVALSELASTPVEAWSPRMLQMWLNNNYPDLEEVSFALVALKIGGKGLLESHRLPNRVAKALKMGTSLPEQLNERFQVSNDALTLILSSTLNPTFSLTLILSSTLNPTFSLTLSLSLSLFRGRDRCSLMGTFMRRERHPLAPISTMGDSRSRS